LGWYPISDCTNASQNVILDEPHDLNDEEIQVNSVQHMLEMPPIQGTIEQP
jgi:hypothetical protein